MWITYTDEDETVLSGEVVDQASLYGYVVKLRDLALPLVLVKPSEEEVG